MNTCEHRLSPFGVGFLFGMIVGLLTAGSAWAQSEPAKQESDETILEEVIVTARYREEILSNVPDAISVFDEQQIEVMRLNDLNIVMNRVPNFVFRERNSFRVGVNSISMRGVSTSGPGFAPVTYVVDGVKAGALQALNSATFFDVERIEVLRGPQGAIYGAGAIAGAVNIVTAQPGNEVEGLVIGSYGKGNDKTFKGYISGPIVKDKLLGRFVAYYRDTDGLIDTESGADLDFSKEYYLRGRLIYLPTDKLSIDLRAAYDDYDGVGAMSQKISSADLINVFDPVLTPMRRGGIQGDNDSKVTDISAKIDYQFAFANLTATGSYVDVDESFYGTLSWDREPALGEPPVTGLLGPVLGANAGPGQPIDYFQDSKDPFKFYTADLRLTSGTEGRFRWVIGTEYIKRKSARDLFIGIIAGPPPGTDVPIYLPADHEEIELWGLYGQIATDLTEQLELTIDARQDWADAQTIQYSLVTGEVLPQTDANGNTVLVNTADSSEFQPKVQLSYRWNDNLMTYLTYAEGFRPAFFATANLVLEETSKNYEFGFKSSTTNDRLSLNGAIFQIDYSNQQRQSFIPTPPFRVPINVPETDIFGVELEMHLLAGEYFLIDVGIGYLDAEVKQLGTSPQFTPEWTNNLGIQFNHPVGSSAQLIARADWRYQDQVQLMQSDGTLYDINDANLVDARVAVDWGSWSVSAYGRNLLDERFATFVTAVRNFYVRDYNYPRSYGIEVAYRF